MNILFFHVNCINPTGGGISRITHIMAKTFVAKGHSVFYLSKEPLTRDSLPEQHVLPDNHAVYSEKNKQFLIDFCKEKSIDVIVNQSALLLSFGKLMREVSKVKRISVLHSSLFVPYRHSAYLIDYKLKKKGLGFVLPILKTQLVNKMVLRYIINKRRPLYRAMVDYSDAVIALTHGQVDDFKLVLTEQQMKRVHVIHNCIEPNPSQSINDERKKQVLWVGTIDFKIKRTDLMLQIWKLVTKQHNDWQLKILGDSIEAKEAKEYANKIKVEQVEFVGRVNPEPYYRESEIVCVTSTHECFCMVLLEALKYGVIPMAFDSFPAAKEEINDGKSGLLIPAFNVKQYARKVSDLMDDYEERMRLRKGALDSARKFDSSIIVDKWIELINRIL